MKPSIFISHSSRRDEFVDSFLDALTAALSPDFEILLDKKLLTPGAQWRHELHTWMGLCHAAIVVLSPGVLEKKDWVLKEATILTWRQTLDPQFLVIPVLAPGMKRSDFAVDFGALHLDDLQTATGCDTAGLVDQLKAKLLPLAQAASGDAPLHKLVQLISGQLSAANVPDKQCLDLAETLAGEPIPWAGLVPARETLAREMIHADFTVVTEVISQLAATIGNQMAEKILEWLFAFWIEPAAATRLAGISARPRKQRAAALNATKSETGDLYVRRGFCNYPPGHAVVRIGKLGERRADEILSQIRAHYRQATRKFDADDQEMDRFIEKKYHSQADKKPVFIVIRERVSPDVIQKLQERLPAFTYLLLMGENFPSENSFEERGIEFVRPELMKNLEQDNYDQLDFARAEIARAVAPLQQSFVPLLQ